MSNLHYKLNPDHSISVCSEEEAEAQFWNPETKRVALSYLDDYRISTSFLVLERGEDEVVPLFETMIFSGAGDPADMDLEYWRYKTWIEAWSGHMVVCQRLAEQIELSRESSRGVILP